MICLGFRHTSRATILAAFALLAATCRPGIASAADIKVLASGALKLALEQLAPMYEKASGNKVTVEYGPAGAIAKRLQSGEAADVGIATSVQIDELIAQGKMVAGSNVAIASVAIGVAIRKGAPRPDIATVEAFKQTLRAAKAIGYRDPATGSNSGTYTAQMIERLGLAAELKSKTLLDNSDGEHPENVFQSLTRGETDIQLGAITEIVLAPGVELLGPLPAEIQKVTLLTAAIPTANKTPEAGKALIGFLAGPAATATLKANGFQPAGTR